MTLGSFFGLFWSLWLQKRLGGRFRPGPPGQNRPPMPCLSGCMIGDGFFWFHCNSTQMKKGSKLFFILSRDLSCSTDTFLRLFIRINLGYKSELLLRLRKEVFCILKIDFPVIF